MTKVVSAKDIDIVCDVINEGKVVAFPTETVYGVGVKFGSREALDRLMEAKNRDYSKAITLMVAYKEDIEKYASYNEKKKTYDWMRLGCFNYAPNLFGTSIPEVTKIKHNSNGTVTLTVDAVCEMVLCNEAVITHELTVKFNKDGSFRYLGNKILNGGIKKIPEYQYRILKEKSKR